jgi:peptide/nickel transport system ATP-binding protein
MAIFEISDFDVTYMTKQRPPFQAVKNASLAIEPGEIVGLVGESGSGKSTLGNAAIRLLDPPGTITGGSVVFDGKDITRYNDDQMRPLRWADISTVFQSSMASLNPVINIESQFRDVIQTHTSVSDSAARQRTSELLEMVNITPSFMRFFPHELSGGMKQRVAIALALALKPKFVLLDEPTTGLDVVVQREILKNLKNIQRALGFAVLIISHDLGVVMEISDRVVVMYNGELVDNQPTNTLLHANLHPYSRKLLNSYRELWGIEPDQESSGTVASVSAASNDVVTPSPPPLDSATAGEIGSSVNAPEARVSVEARANLMHRTGQAGSGQVVLRVSDIVKTYSRRRGFVTSTVAAVQHVSFELERGRILALVGQSGSGKSTIGRLVTGVERPDSGSIVFTENTTPVDIRTLGHKALNDYRRHAQLVFQDPYSALNPAHTVAHSLARPLQNYRKMNGKDARAECRKMLERVGLTPAERFIDKYPHQLSGGQRQRVVVARALAPNPEILIADEPTSMLDVSIRAEILGLLNDLVRDENLAMLYITHDLLSARLLADEIMVLNEGRIVESGSAEQVIEHPQDDYTQLLLRSIPNPFATSDMAAD